MKIPFAKYQGAGNDFIIIDQSFSFSADLVRILCDRRRGIGADGVLLLQDSTLADYRMRIFNADGSEPAMCGNGIRCLFQYLRSIESLSQARIETRSGIYACRAHGDKVAVDMGAPKEVHFPIQLEQGEAYILDTGVPHAVLFVEDPSRIDLEKQGKAICSRFAPDGVNVNFASISPKEVRLRTYERGVGETLACGTGATAVAYAAHKLLHLSSPIKISTRSSFDGFDYQSHLEFVISGSSVEMIGEAVRVFEGVWEGADHRHVGDTSDGVSPAAPLRPISLRQI